MMIRLKVLFFMVIFSFNVYAQEEVATEPAAEAASEAVPDADEDHENEDDHEMHRHLAGYNMANPYDMAQRKKREFEIEKNGFSDVEIDYLHRDIASMYYQILPDLTENHGFSVRLNENTMVMPLSFGEIIKGLSDRYLYNAETHITIDPESKTLKNIMVRFDRTASTGTRFTEERRELTNPTPFYSKELDTTEKFDTNTDIYLDYYEQNKPQGSFKKVATLGFEEIGMFDKKEKMKNQYKVYLRQTLIRMRSLKQVIDRNRRVYYDHLLDMGD